MKSFLKEFLRDVSSEGGATPRICLGAFGKHPAWDDHMDDIGLETESLVAARRLLYQQGIGAQLDSGAWAKLDDAVRLPAIYQEFVWAREKQVLVGRMWPSTDGKRRDLYPMVACAQGFDMTAETAIRHLLPYVREIEFQCRATRLATKVAEIFRDGREHCNSAAAETAEEPGTKLSFELPAEFIEGPFAGILREVRNRMAPYLSGRFKSRADAPAACVRAPSVAETEAEDLIFWNRFFAALIATESPLLLLRPIGQPWVDVMAGEPNAQDFFVLRAAPPAIPILGESSLAIDEKERREAASLWQAIADPEKTAEWEALQQGQSWLSKIFG